MRKNDKRTRNREKFEFKQYSIISSYYHYQRIIHKEKNLHPQEVFFFTGPSQSS